MPLRRWRILPFSFERLDFVLRFLLLLSNLLGGLLGFLGGILGLFGLLLLLLLLVAILAASAALKYALEGHAQDFHATLAAFAASYVRHEA